MKVAAAYARVSTKKQSETSIETQLEDCRKFAVENGIRITAEFTDKVTASGSARRPGFSEMIDRALNHEWSYIIVQKQDRFERNNVEEQVLLKKLEDIGVYVLYAKGNIDPTTPTGQLYRWILSGINQFYIKNLQDEINSKTTKVAQRAYFLGGIPPYGFTTKNIRDPEASRTRRIYEIDENEAPIVREIFRLAAEGQGYGEIAERLNRDGFRTRNGAAWSKITLKDMVRNEKYVGTYTFRKGKKHNYHAQRDDTIRIPNAIPAIVDTDTWEKVQAKLTSITRLKDSTHSPLLKGFVYCGDCGERMYSCGVKYQRYQCGRWFRKRDVKCISIGEAKADKFVLSYLKKILLSNIDFEELARGYNEQAAVNNIDFQKQMEELEKQEIEFRSMIARATRAILEGSPLAAELERQSSVVAAQLEEVLKKKEKLRNNTAIYITADALERKINDYRELLGGDRHAQRRLVEEVVGKVIVSEGGLIEVFLKGEEESSRTPGMCLR